MCGIAGWVNFDGEPVQKAKLEAMSALQSHRGPDGEAIWLEKGVALAHKRLAIIDINGGSQPMESADGRYVVTYNGELYNYRELKKELGGYPFKTSSDTEVLLASYARWGADCLSRFNGIFAFAVWDRAEKKLFMARDHYGVKPIYYSIGNGRLLFASEMKAILGVDQKLKEFDVESLNTMLTYRYSPAPSTLFKKIKKLRPGHYLILKGSELEEKRYFIGDNSGADAGTVSDAEKLLDAAVSRQLVSDVPVGILLSGGLDSTLLATLAAKRYGGSLTAFTVGFKGDHSFDELKYAADTAKLLGINHEKIEIDHLDFLSALEDVVWHMEEPVATSSSVPLYLLCREIGKSHKVVLSGQGVDELFGGYFRHRAEKLSGALRPLFGSRLLGMLASSVKGFSGLKRAFYALGERDDTARFLKTFSVFNSYMRDGILADAFPDDMSAIEYYASDIKGRDSLSKMLWVEMRTSLPDDLLLYTDKVSMAHSVEVRVPYLDINFACFVEQLSSDKKVRGFNGKVFFREMAKRKVPAEVINRKKLGFETPAGDWFRSELSKDFVEIVCDKGALTRNIFKDGAVEAMVKKHRQGRDDYSRHLFMLISLELWAKRFGVTV